MRRSCEREEKNIDLRRQYTYSQAIASTIFGKQENYVEDVYYIGDTRHNRRNGKIKKRKESASDRKEQQEFRRKVPEAYHFKLIGEEPVNGRTCYKIEAEPKPGFKELSKVRGTVWIDKAQYEWAKIDAELIEPMSFSLGLFKASKGTKFNMELGLVNNEVWFPQKLKVHAAARVAYFKNGILDFNILWSNFKKFTVDSTVKVTEP